MKRSGKAKQAVVVCRMFRLLRGHRAIVSLMQAKLRKRDFVNRRSLGELRAGGQQQRLHDQRVDRGGAKQASAEAQHRTCLI